MFGKTIDVNSAVLQRSKQQRSEDHSNRMIPTEQRHRNSGKAVVIGEAVVIAIAIAKHFVDSDHAGERAGDCHRKNYLFANRNAAVLCCKRVTTGRTNFVTPLRSPEKHVD